MWFTVKGGDKLGAHDQESETNRGVSISYRHHHLLGTSASQRPPLLLLGSSMAAVNSTFLLPVNYLDYSNPDAVGQRVLVETLNYLHSIQSLCGCWEQK